MIGRYLAEWFRKHVAGKLTGQVDEVSEAAEKPVRQTGQSLGEFAKNTAPDQDLEGRRQLEQTGFGAGERPGYLQITDRSTPGLEAVVGRLGDRVAGDSVVLGRDAVDAAFGSRTHQGAKLEVSVTEDAYRYLREQPGWSHTQAADGTPRLVDGNMSIGMGWDAGPSHPDLFGRSWTTPEGIHVASLPDVYAVLQERGSPQDLLDAAAIRHRLLDPTQPPLPAPMLAREMDTIRSILPAEALDHPDADIAVRLGANGMHIASTLYGDPAVGRANQIIGDLELPGYRVPATYHNGFGLAEDGRLLQEHLGNIGARPHERLDAAAADTYSDSVYGNGRRSNNPEGYDELRSADLARAHALSLGYEPDRADRIHDMITGTAFDEHTKAQAGKHHPDPLVHSIAGVDLQTLAQPSCVADVFDLAPEDLASQRHSPDRILGRTLVDHDLRIRSTEEGMTVIDEYAEYRPTVDGVASDRTVMDAFANRIAGNAGFSDPRTGHQYPPTWTLDNPELRAEHTEKARELGQKLADRDITATQAHQEAQRHTAAMQEKYGR
ncbi:hypothetical protein B0T36_06320 [Nocardia donostiensis]|uniref:hypothetical protein n=1 Tax=Nocardia donostiensis TaxID=1538463 RepID=UPI0009D95F0A|nr:hypothetical protein [Nocardia donostiensis]OQS16362.1 hypothetical protein B0T36_06320 [Nocardia donostiensis]